MGSGDDISDLAAAETEVSDEATAETLARDVASAETMAADTPGGAAGSTLTASSRSTGAPVLRRTPLPTVDRDAYEILGEHGRGGLGRILRARDTRTGRLVAIKEMLHDHAEAARRFRREALITANLQHPAIVPVYEVGCWPDGAPFYCMKLVAGRSLREVIADAGTLDARLALLPHAIAVADALAYAHSLGVIHRDLKPANVLCGDFGETVVIDWGLARDRARPDDDVALPEVARVEPGLTRAGSLLGTPAYMPPEQAAGDEVDERADVYALGAMLYHLLAGRMPYADSRASDVIDDVLDGPPRPIAELAPDAPTDLRAILAKAMARAPADRYASAGELAAELRRFQTGQLVAAHSYTRRERLARFARRHRAAVVIGALAGVALIGGGVASYLGIARERDAAHRERDHAEAARGLAEDANATARARLAELHAELGRRELGAGAALRALPHLAEAARARGTVDDSMAYAVGRALEPVLARTTDHQAPAKLTALAASPDRRRAAVLTGARTLSIVDLATGATTRSIDAGAEIVEVAWRDDDVVIAVGRQDAAWDATTGARLWQRTPAAPSLRVAAAGGTIAIGDLVGGIDVLAAGDFALIAEAAAHAGAIDDLALSRDGTRLVTVGDGLGGALWETRTLRRIAVLPGAYDVDISAAGTVIAGGARELVAYRAGDGVRLRTLPVRGTVRFHHALGPDRFVSTTDAGEVIIHADASEVSRLEGHPSSMLLPVTADAAGELIATGDHRGTIRLWHAGTGELLGTLEVGAQPIWLAQLDAGGQRLLTITGRGRQQTWDVARAISRRSLPGHAGGARRAAYARDGQTVVTGGRDGGLRVWDPRIGQLRRVIDAHDDHITWLDLSADGSRVISASKDGLARIWNVATGTGVATLRGHQGEVGRALYSADGRFIVTTSTDRTARVWDAASGALKCTSVEHDAPIFAAAVAHHGDFFVTWEAGPSARVIGFEDCAVRRTLATSMGQLIGGAISPDDRLLGIGGVVPAASQEQVVALFDLATGARRQLATWGEDMSPAVAFSADGTLLATAGGSGAVRLWRVADGTIHADLAGAETVVGAVAFGRGDHLLIGGSDDETVRVWDTASGRLIDTLSGHTSGVYFVRVSPAGDQLATAGLDDAPRLWTLPRWRGSLAELEALVACRSPWRLRGSDLTAVELPASCP